jgi:hypothetical protein
MTRSHLASLLVALTAALALASAALAGGEPKNVAPFTRVIAPTSVSLAGEPKNQSPFNRGVAKTLVDTTLSATGGAGPHRAAAVHSYGVGVQAPADTRGEPKNETPFTRSVTRIAIPTVVTKPSQAFNWRDAAYGAAAMAAIGLLIAALAETRRRSYKHALGA